MKQPNDIMEAFSAEIKNREKRYGTFNLPLADDLYLLAQNAIPELKTVAIELKKELYMRAFFRAGELSNFMMERVLEEETDETVDTALLKVTPREEAENSVENRFIYDCFDLTKKKLWIAFPEMSEFSGNSILHMNYYAFECMKQFNQNIQAILNS